MQLRDEFNQLMDKFKRGVEGKGPANLADLFKDSLVVFEKLKDRLSQSNEQERAEILKLINEMHEFLSAETKKLAEKTGLTEEQMLRYAENPNNFTTEQWSAIQMIRNRLGKTAVQMADVLKRKPEVEKPPSIDSENVKKVKKGPGFKKDKWMKS